MKIKHIYESSRPTKAVKSSMPSMAIPGQSYNIAQVIERVRAGLPTKVLGYGYNPDGFPVMDDLTTLEQFKKAVKVKEQKINEKVKAVEAQNKAAERSDKAE